MIPTAADLASDTLGHRFGELFNPPGLTNFLGTVQAETDVMGIRAPCFPPLSQAGAPTARLFLDDRFVPALGQEVRFRWRPDRIERELHHDGLVLRTLTCMPPGHTAVLVRLAVENRTERPRDARLRLALDSAVCKGAPPWDSPVPPGDAENEWRFDSSRGAFVSLSHSSAAACLQGSRALPGRVRDRSLEYSPTIAPGGCYVLDFVHATGECEEEAKREYDWAAGGPDQAIACAERAWDAELAAAFTPGNGSFSGSLPVLETGDPALQKLYLNGVLGVLCMRRDNSHSVLGRVYDTLMPRYWQTVTFLWDYSESSLVHALLDPEPMRRQLEHWMSTDVHAHMGTEWLSGAPVGMWYSINDHAIVRCCRDYLAWSGDLEWTEHKVGGQAGVDTVAERIDAHALSWERFRGPGGLADYGGIGNLLECVSSYVHEVAGLNATNVFNLRVAAELAGLQGRHAEAEARRRAGAEVARLVRDLYLPGRGCFAARGPDGALTPVRHCYDFSTVLNMMGGDLDERQRSEMVYLFESDLQSPRWVHALSSGDPDAAFSVRPDHQWTGGFCSWPAEAALALLRHGHAPTALEWLREMAKSANQGPFGQAHFADDIVPPHAGGARKAPPEAPYICDWACSAGGAWVSTIIEGVLGVRAGLDGSLSASPVLGAAGPDAALHGLVHRGRSYVVDRGGARPE